MEMIVHQTIMIKIDLVFLSEILQQVQVMRFVRILTKDKLFVISSCHDVKRKFSGNNS